MVTVVSFVFALSAALLSFALSTALFAFATFAFSASASAAAAVFLLTAFFAVSVFLTAHARTIAFGFRTLFNFLRIIDHVDVFAFDRRFFVFQRGRRAGTRAGAGAGTGAALGRKRGRGRGMSARFAGFAFAFFFFIVTAFAFFVSVFVSVVIVIVGIAFAFLVAAVAFAVAFPASAFRFIFLVAAAFVAAAFTAFSTFFADLIASADAIFAFIISTTALLITRRTVHRFFFARTTIRGRTGRIAARRRIGTRRRIGRSRIRRSFVSFFGSFFFFLFARGIVIFALLFEGSDFYADAAVVASERHGRVDLTFSVVHRFAGILRLSRHAFAESNGTDRTGFDRRV